MHLYAMIPALALALAPACEPGAKQPSESTDTSAGSESGSDTTGETEGPLEDLPLDEDLPPDPPESARLIAMKWTGSVEQVLSVDLELAQPTALGQLGDDFWGWQKQATVSPDGSTLHVFGMTQDEVRKLYVFDLDAEVFVEAVETGPELWEVLLAGRDASERLIGMRWSGVAEDVIAIDLDGPSATVLGQMGDLMWWSRQAAINPESATLYALGKTADELPQLYSFDLEADAYLGAIANDPMLDEAALAGFDAQNRLIGAWWSGTAEEVIAIDPDTLAVEVLGELGDLHLWSRELVMNPDKDRVYTVAYDPDEQTKLYSFDLANDAFLAGLPAPELFDVTLVGFAG